MLFLDRYCSTSVRTVSQVAAESTTRTLSAEALPIPAAARNSRASGDELSQAANVFSEFLSPVLLVAQSVAIGTSRHIEIVARTNVDSSITVVRKN